MYIERREKHTCIAWIITNRFRIVQAPSLAEVLPVKSLPSHETVSNPLLTCSCTVIPPLDNSDHNGLLTRLLWRSSSSHNCPNHSKGHTVWLYRHADWARAGELLESVDWESLSDDNIDVSWTNYPAVHAQGVK